jgi:hypothetical protein
MRSMIDAEDKKKYQCCLLDASLNLDHGTRGAVLIAFISADFYFIFFG